MAHVHRYLGPQYFGFRKGVGTGEMPHYLRRLFDLHLFHPRAHLYVHSVDFEKAFDSVHPEKLPEVYASWGIPPKTSRLLTKLSTCFISVLGVKGQPASSKKKQGRGLRTRDPRASIDFMPMLAWVLEAADQSVERVHGPGTVEAEKNKFGETSATYADDFNGLSSSLGIGSTRAEALRNYGEPFGPNVSFEKSGVLHARARGKQLGDKNIPSINFSDGAVIQGKETMGIAGSIFSRNRVVIPELRRRESRTWARWRDIKTYTHEVGGRKAVLHIATPCLETGFTCGLDPFPMRPSEEKRIDSCQIRVIRAALRFTPPWARGTPKEQEWTGRGWVRVSARAWIGRENVPRWADSIRAARVRRWNKMLSGNRLQPARRLLVDDADQAFTHRARPAQRTGPNVRPPWAELVLAEQLLVSPSDTHAQIRRRARYHEAELDNKNCLGDALQSLVTCTVHDSPAKAGFLSCEKELRERLSTSIGEKKVGREKSLRTVLEAFHRDRTAIIQRWRFRDPRLIIPEEIYEGRQHLELRERSRVMGCVWQNTGTARFQRRAAKHKKKHDKAKQFFAAKKQERQSPTPPPPLHPSPIAQDPRAIHLYAIMHMYLSREAFEKVLEAWQRMKSHPYKVLDEGDPEASVVCRDFGGVDEP